MKKVIILAVIILMVFLPVVYGEHYTQTPHRPGWTPSFYGNVYLWSDNAPLVWAVISQVKAKNEWLEMQDKTTALINKGEVENIRITAPYKYSMISIYYKEHIYYFSLKPKLLGHHFILFTFRSDY